MVFLLIFILGDRPKNVFGDDLEFSLVNETVGYINTLNSCKATAKLTKPPVLFVLFPVSDEMSILATETPLSDQFQHKKLMSSSHCFLFVCFLPKNCCFN